MDRGNENQSYLRGWTHEDVFQTSLQERGNELRGTGNKLQAGNWETGTER